MNWEYETIKFSATEWFVGGNLDDSGIKNRLNELGRSGWELVSMVSTTGGGSTEVVVAVLKRPLP